MKTERSKRINKAKIIYHIGRLSEKEQWELDFQDALSRPAAERIKLGFILIKMPIIDDVPYRIFDTIDNYRRWANKNLPKWLGYNNR